ncbi:hypothetical protein LIMNO130_80075 [Limnobacter sp. 130]|nr:hypothetical protein LIMNO130_80075 [Limnobacter sp. 130]
MMLMTILNGKTRLILNLFPALYAETDSGRFLFSRGVEPSKKRLVRLSALL